MCLPTVMNRCSFQHTIVYCIAMNAHRTWMCPPWLCIPINFNYKMFKNMILFFFCLLPFYVCVRAWKNGKFISLLIQNAWRNKNNIHRGWIFVINTKSLMKKKNGKSIPTKLCIFIAEIVFLFIVKLLNTFKWFCFWFDKRFIILPFIV